MKKLIITLISIFVFVNIAFAQSATDKKVDSLKNEQAKAEQAKKAADDRLRNDMNDKNYQAAKTAREKMEKVNKELEAALNEQKVEQEAKAKAKAEAEAVAKKVEEDRLMALYYKRFPEFEFAGVSDEFKEYIFKELKKDPNWEILDIYRSSYKKRVKRHYHSAEWDGWYWGDATVPALIIKSSSNTEGEKFDALYRKEGWGEDLLKAWEYRKNPEKFYLAKKEKEKERESMEKFIKENNALNKMQKAVVAYYKEYAGKNYDIKSAIVLKKCKSVAFYYIDVPKQNNINFVFNQNNNSAFMKRQHDVNYVYAVCGRDTEFNIIIRPNHSYFDKIYAEQHPRKTIKTFKIEDYM